MTKRLRRPKLKDGELRIYWGRLPHDSPDIVFAWQGDRMMKRDTNYLHYVLGCKHPDPQAQPIFSKMNPSFFEELDSRGYDLTTLKFSIMKRNLPPRRIRTKEPTMNAPENIYIVQWPSHQSPGGKWHTEIPVIPHPEWIYQYIRHDIHAAVVAENEELRKQIKIVQNAARNLEISGREIAKHDLARAEKLFSESKPEVIDSEREANSLLTEENLRLEQENEQLRAEVERLNKLAAAISKDCNETALQRNAAQNEASQLRARLDAAMAPIEGDVLPAIGTDVLIHLNSSDSWVKHTVVGYYVWADHDGNPHLQRVFVRVKDKDGHLNARMLCDVRRADATPTCTTCAQKPAPMRSGRASTQPPCWVTLTKNRRKPTSGIVKSPSLSARVLDGQIDSRDNFQLHQCDRSQQIIGLFHAETAASLWICWESYRTLSNIKAIHEMQFSRVFKVFL